MIAPSMLLPVCLLMAALQTTAVAGRGQHLMPPDEEGEILDPFMSGGGWRGIMTGLERPGDHGLFVQDKLLGVLTLPEVFGTDPCEKFTPTEIPLYAAPDVSSMVGSIRVDQYWTFHDVGGCEGLTVNVHQSDGRAVRALPVKEHDYEQPGAIVLEQRGRWFKVRLAGGAAWLHASPRAEYLSLERLLADSLAYLTDHWDGRLAKSPDMPTVEVPSPGAAPSVHIIGFQEPRGQLWVHVSVLSHSPCTSAEEPRVVAQGWLPAHAVSGEPAIWFYSRGC
jgi:hypothetical protein